VLEGLSGWDALEEADVLVVTAAVEEESEAGATGEGAPAPKKKKKKNKAELRDQMGKKDPYDLLELEDLRWRATADDIRKAYRRLVLQHHPDKQNSSKPAEEEAVEEGEKAPRASEAAEEEGDEMFKAITDAFELLSTPKKRRDFDSLDEFDDSIPSFDAAGDDFLQVFAPVFTRNSRWSEVQPAPLLGEADAPFEEVAVFYNFWFGFKSWRDFADADEYNPDEDAHFREEKRFMEKENEKLRKVQRKKEARRVERLVERAYENDPRVKRHALEEKEGKARAKAERQAKQAADRAGEQQRKEDEAAAEAAAREAEEAGLKAEISLT